MTSALEALLRVSVYWPVSPSVSEVVPVMPTVVTSPWLPVPGVPEPGSSVTAVLTGVLSRVSCSNLPTSVPLTEAIALITGSLVPT
ncbi:hypothetical protein D3C81_2115820 [compost metagenome]